ncbi:MAG: hypothetical protein IK144_07075 [Bacteroidaceae bacterium]|nr:hypothetical protein [Bacteroidaceae bacterium]
MKKQYWQNYFLPSLQGRGLGVGLLLCVAIVFCACSSDDDNNVNDPKNAAYTETSLSEAPVWQIDWTGNQERPNWTEPDASIYENWTILKVQIEEALLPYASEGDLMALFVNGELRGLASPAVIVGSDKTGNGKFLMKVYGNESGTETVRMSLQYYCQNLKQIFTLSDNISLDSDETTGIDEAFIPKFTLGSAKYPVVKAVEVENILKKVGISPVPGYLVGAFVGDECRGTATLSASGSTQLVIYGRNVGESVTVKYFDTVKGVMYTIPNAVKL